MRYSLILIALLVAPIALHAQAVRFGSNTYTTNSGCSGGSLCPVLAIPGATVNFCSGTASTLALCLASPATTYTSFTAVTPCATTAQLTPATTSNPCTTKSNNQGEFGAWLLPGQYSFYLRPPSNAGGGTYGPYPVNVGASAGCPLGVTCDASYSTLPLACTAAGAGTLYVTKTWSGLTTQSLACNIQAVANGIIKPASGQTVTLTGSFSGTLTQHFDLSAGGTVVLPSTSPIEGQWFGAVGDNSTNTTTAVSNAITVAAASGASLHFTAGTYRICNVAPTTTSGATISLYGDGPKSTMFTTHSSCLAQSANMIAIQTTGAVYLHDFGIDSLNATGTPFTGYDIVINPTGNAQVGPSKVDIDHLYVARGQVVGLQINNASNVTISNSTFDHNEWFGVSVGCGMGSTVSPVYQYGYNIHGNTYTQNPIGLGINFFCSDISVSNEVYQNSNLSFVQTPHAKASVSGITIQGDPTAGCIVDGNCGGYGTQNAIFMEGVSDIDIGDVWISDIAHSSQGGITCLGSTLQIPYNGTVMNLPCSNVHIHDSTLNNVTGNPILLSGVSPLLFSYDNPTSGVNNSVKAVSVTNSNDCGAMGSMTGFSFTDNFCANSNNGGWTFSSVVDGYIGHNYCYNCNVAGGTTYSTGTVSGTKGSTAITGSGTTFSVGMVGGGFTVNGTTYTVASYSSATSIALSSPLAAVASGASYTLRYGGGGSYAGILLNGAGTYSVEVDSNTLRNDAGNALHIAFEDNTGLTPAVSQIRYDQNNTCSGPCGTFYYPVPTLMPTISSCGSAPSIASYSTNTQGRISPDGAVTACTIVFAGTGFVNSPACNFMDSSNLTFYVSAESNTQVTVTSSGSMSGTNFGYTCTGTLANPNYYPVPQ